MILLFRFELHAQKIHVCFAENARAFNKIFMAKKSFVGRKRAGSSKASQGRINSTGKHRKLNVILKISTSKNLENVPKRKEKIIVKEKLSKESSRNVKAF